MGPACAVVARRAAWATAAKVCAGLANSACVCWHSCAGELLCIAIKFLQFENFNGARLRYAPELAGPTPIRQMCVAYINVRVNAAILEPH